MMFCLFAILCLPISLTIKGQNVLESGVVSFKIARPELMDSANTETLICFFGASTSVQHSFPANKEGIALTLLDLKDRKHINVIVTPEDTFALNFSFDTSRFDKPLNKDFKTKFKQKKTKHILGYECSFFSVSPVKNSLIPFKLEAWVTNQIQTKHLPEILGLFDVKWPGFPLEIMINDIQTDSGVAMKAEWVRLLGDSLLTLKKEEVLNLWKGYTDRHKNDLQARRKLIEKEYAFRADTSITLSIQVDTLWEVVEIKPQMITLECKSLAARCYISREAELHPKEAEQQMTDLLFYNQNYLVVLESPSPPIETIMFRGKVAKQQIWNFHNQAILEHHIYPKEHNPFNLFPMENLVIRKCVFNVQDIECMAVIQTTKSNFDNILQSVDQMLNTLEIKGL